jgi:hypothetical protein
MLLPVHIAAGGLAIVLGAVALSVKKGGTLHRRSGLLFVYSMLVMGTSASTLGLRNGLIDGNVIAGFITAYFVATALTTVRPASQWTRRINAAAFALGLGLALVAFVGGVKNVHSPRISPGGVPFRTIGVMSFFLATLLLLAAIGDLRIMRFGLPRGGPRLARHLWRMCFALFIPVRIVLLNPRARRDDPSGAIHEWGDARAADPAAVGTMFYWLWRVRGRRTLPVLVRHDPVPVASGELTWGNR